MLDNKIKKRRGKQTLDMECSVVNCTEGTTTPLNTYFEER